MRNFLTLSECDIGTIKLPYTEKDNTELSENIYNIMNISIQNTTDELFFIDLLKITIDAVNHIPDNQRRSIKFKTVYNEICKLKILNRYIVVDFYNCCDRSDFICSLSVSLNLKSFVETLLNDYKELAETGLLKSFTKEDRDYMRIINKYYQELYDLYKATL